MTSHKARVERLEIQSKDDKVIDIRVYYIDEDAQEVSWSDKNGDHVLSFSEFDRLYPKSSRNVTKRRSGMV